jgi:hypothetical protein
MVNLAADSRIKFRIFYLNTVVENTHVPKTLFLFFAIFSPAIFFCGSEFLSTVKPNSQRSLGPMSTFPFPGGVIGNIF